MEWNSKSRNKPIVYGNKSYIIWGGMNFLQVGCTHLDSHIEKLDSFLIPCTKPINQKFKCKKKNHTRTRRKKLVNSSITWK